jgi:uncharacterized membrane protein
MNRSVNSMNRILPSPQRSSGGSGFSCGGFGGGGGWYLHK